MPDGIVQWFDTETGEGRVLHRRRRYAVEARDVETDARTPGARVHFDIDHASDGARATNVTLRRGIRSAKAQRRFGDTTGAPTANAKKPLSTGQDNFDIDPEVFRNPVRAAEHWADRLSARDLDEALLLYSPTAALHTGGSVHVGRNQIRRALEVTPLIGAPSARVRGEEDGTVVVRWPIDTDGERSREGTESRLRIRRGEITEQWLGTLTEAEESTDDSLPLEISVDGQVTQRHRDRVADRITRVLSKVDDPVLHARVRLVNVADSGRDRPAIARVMLDVNGEPVRAEVVGTDLDSAIDSLEQRLAHQLDRMTTHRETLRRRGPGSAAGEWRHGDLPTDRPDHHPRPAEEREVVRHKTFTTVEATVDEAIFDMEALDYDFFLFTDLATGQEAFITRQEGGVYGVQLQEGLDEEHFVREVAAAVDPHADPAQRLTLDEARELLDGGVDDHVFFTDADNGRGHVLYRRYDGHYGLITPRSEEEAPVAEEGGQDQGSGATDGS